MGKWWYVRIQSLVFSQGSAGGLWKCSWETILRPRLVLRSLIWSRGDLAAGVIPTLSCAVSGHTQWCGDDNSSGCSTCHPAGDIFFSSFYFHGITVWRTWPELRFKTFTFFGRFFLGAEILWTWHSCKGGALWDGPLKTDRFHPSRQKCWWTFSIRKAQPACVYVYIIAYIYICMVFNVDIFIYKTTSKNWSLNGNI